MRKPLSLTFIMNPNNGIHPGTEVIVFKECIAPAAGQPSRFYTEYIPREYHEGYNAWALGGIDHYGVFKELSKVFSPEELRERALAIESGLDISGEFRPEDLRFLAEEIEESYNCSLDY